MSQSFAEALNVVLAATVTPFMATSQPRKPFLHPPRAQVLADLSGWAQQTIRFAKLWHSVSVFGLARRSLRAGGQR